MEGGGQTAGRGGHCRKAGGDSEKKEKNSNFWATKNRISNHGPRTERTLSTIMEDTYASHRRFGGETKECAGAPRRALLHIKENRSGHEGKNLTGVSTGGVQRSGVLTASWGIDWEGPRSFIARDIKLSYFGGDLSETHLSVIHPQGALCRGFARPGNVLRLRGGGGWSDVVKRPGEICSGDP